MDKQLTSGESFRQYFNTLNPEQQQSIYNRMGNLLGYERLTVKPNDLMFSQMAQSVLRTNPYLQQLQQQYLDRFNNQLGR